MKVHRRNQNKLEKKLILVQLITAADVPSRPCSRPIFFFTMIMQMIIPTMRGTRRRMIIEMTFGNVPLVVVVSVVSVAFAGAVAIVAVVDVVVDVVVDDVVIVVVVVVATVPLQSVPVMLPTLTHENVLILELYTQPLLLWHVIDSHIGPLCVVRHTQLYESALSRYLHVPRLQGFLQGRLICIGRNIM